MNTTAKIALIAAISGFSMLLVGESLAAARTLKFSVSVPAEHAAGKGLARFAELVAKRSDGALDVQPFYNNQLGGELEVAQGIQLGSVEGALLTIAVLSRWAPEGDVFELPFIYRNNEHWKSVVMGPFGIDFAKRYERHGFKFLAFTSFGSRNLMSTFPIQRPSDVRGKKMRIMQNPLHAATWKALGANPTPIPAPEIYNAMQTGLADYFDNNIISWNALKFHEVAPYLTKSAHMHQPTAFLMNAQLFESLSEKLKTIIADSAKEAAAYQWDLVGEMEKSAIQAAQQNGGKVLELLEYESWAKATEPVWEQWAQKVPGGSELIKEIQRH